MALDMRGSGDAEPEKKNNRFGNLGQYRNNDRNASNDNDSGTDDADIYVVDGERLPDEVIEKSKEGMRLVDDLVRAFDLMQATEGREGTKEYARLLFQAANDKTLTLLVITAGITAISHLREAHGEH